MLAPVHTAGGKEDLSADVEVYFPGSFFDYWTGEEYCGGRKINYHAPLDTLPVFVKKGAVIPMLGQIMNTEEYTGENYELHLYPAQEESTFILYFDDGVTLDYEKGIYDAVEIRCVKKEDGIHVHFVSLSDCMPIRRIEFAIWLHEEGGIRLADVVAYEKVDFDIVL